MFVGLMDYFANQTDNITNYLSFETSTSVDTPEQLFYYVNGSSFYCKSAIESECYVGIHLKKNLFAINSFSIQTSFNAVNYSIHPLTWKLIGSNDGINWDILDSHQDDDVLNGFSLMVHFSSQEYVVKYIRFVSPSPFKLRTLDFFGSLYPNNIVFPTCKAIYYFNQNPSIWSQILVFILI